MKLTQTTVLRLKCDTKLMRVYGSLHLTNKVMIKEQFTQGMQAELQPTSLRETKKRLIFGLALGKPIHGRWIVSAFYRVAKNIASVMRGWRLAGLLTE